MFRLPDQRLSNNEQIILKIRAPLIALALSTKAFNISFSHRYIKCEFTLQQST